MGVSLGFQGDRDVTDRAEALPELDWGDVLRPTISCQAAQSLEGSPQVYVDLLK